MKRTLFILGLAVSLSAFTASARPGDRDPRATGAGRPEVRGGRAAQTFERAKQLPGRSPREQNLRGPQAQRHGMPGMGPRGGFNRGGNRDFGPAVGPMGRGFRGPGMMPQGRGPGRGEFFPPMARGRGPGNFGPGAGPMRRGFGGPPMMNNRGPQARRDFAPPQGQMGRPGMGPMRPGAGGPPGMQPGGGNRGQFAPPMNRGMERGGFGPGPMGRGFGGPQMNDNRGGRPQPGFDQRGPRRGGPEMGQMQPNRPGRGGRDQAPPDRGDGPRNHKPAPERD